LTRNKVREGKQKQDENATVHKEEQFESQGREIRIFGGILWIIVEGVLELREDINKNSVEMLELQKMRNKRRTERERKQLENKGEKRGKPSGEKV